MELICNELSFHPLAVNSQQVEERFRTMLRAFRESKTTFDFTHIRFPVNYSSQQVTATQTLIEWISNLTNPTIRNLIFALFKNPFTDDLTEAETNDFFESEYTILSEEAPNREDPIGMPVAFIKSVPTISFDSHNFWRNRKIEISKTGTIASENVTFQVYNICLENDIVSAEMNDWAENCFPQFIDSAEMIVRYLRYQKFTSNFSADFLQQFFEWKESNIQAFKYLLLLMKDIELHPFTGGRGQTENLKGKGKEASKRINNKYPDGDRLSYTVENNVVTFIACKGHYEFHN